MSDPAGHGFERFIGSAKSAASSLRVKSALNPMLWLCAIVTLPCFGLAYLSKDTLLFSAAFLLMGGLPILATIVGFVYFMLRAPERLQSEEYQIRHEALELIKSKGSSVEVLPSSLEAIWNPAIVALPSPEVK